MTLEDESTAVVRIAGEVDVATTPIVTGAIHDALARGATRLVLDMSAVTFMDSSGIAALITTRTAAPTRLRSPSEAVLRLLATTGLTDTFALEP